VAVATHLVSRISDPTGARRGEQAARLREIVDGVACTEPGALVLGGGDLNDEPSSAPLSPLLADGEWTDPLAELGLADAWTWLGGGGGARLDYLLLPRRSAWLVIDAGVAEGADVSAASDHRPLVLDVAWGR
jgi:endonuclease/exonuclease/phosphatase family metal-dependent hydrolase